MRCSHESWLHLPATDQWAHNRCCSVRHSGNCAVGSWSAQKIIRIPKEEQSEVCSLQLIVQVMWSVQALQEIQSAPEWQCSILHILFTQKLWTDPGDLQFSSPSLHLTPFISAPPCASSFHPVFLQHPYLSHHLTSLCSFPPSVLIEICSCILSLYLNNEMWDITGCGKYPGFNT